MIQPAHESAPAKNVCPLCGTRGISAGLSVNVTANIAWLDGKTIRLTAREAELLQAMLDEWPEPVKRERLFLRVWGCASDVNPHIIPVIVCKLNRKIAEAGYTVRGHRGRRGYEIHKIDAHAT